MKICVAQTRSVPGDIKRNIDKHKKWIDLAISKGADIIIFPELSLTGYEPKLAKTLATTPDDIRFNDFQKMSDANSLVVGVGMPTKNNAGVCISMILFQPHQPRLVYSKKYIHPDEEEFFIRGENLSCLKIKETNIALAICYELSIPEHSATAFKSEAQVYIASVAKSANGVEKACKSLSEIASQYSMTVLMANCVGPSDDFDGAGKTSIWNSTGMLAGELGSVDEGILMIDTETEKVSIQTV
jgi:predicted amidohydrolase